MSLYDEFLARVYVTYPLPLGLESTSLSLNLAPSSSNPKLSL